MFNLIENISKNSNLLNEIKKKQITYSDKSVYENINNQILKVINYEKALELLKKKLYILSALVELE